MLIISSFFEIFDAAFQEVHKGVLVEVVGTGFHQEVTVVVHKAVIRLGVGAELRDLEVGILAPDGLLFLAVVSRSVPFLFRQGSLVIDIQSTENEVVAQHILHTRVAPHVGFHLAAVDAAVAREVDENRLVGSFRGGQGLVVVEIAF